MIKADITQGKSPLFLRPISSPKSSSTTCLHVAWKSNQTDLTKDLAHSYNFYPYNKYCTGHTKLKATTGPAYQYDLADSVYCSCGQPTIKGNDSVIRPPPLIVLNPALSKGSANSFFNQERKSIHHLHRTLICYHRVKMKQVDPIPHMTHPPRKPTTRGDSRKKEQEEKNRDTHQDLENSDQENESNHTPVTSNMQPAQHQEDQEAEATGLSTGAITSMVVHMVQGIATIGDAPAYLFPGSAITANNSMGERQDPDGSPQIILPPAPPPHTWPERILRSKSNE
jgi:hypothetical protein